MTDLIVSIRSIIGVPPPGCEKYEYMFACALVLLTIYGLLKMARSLFRG